MEGDSEGMVAIVQALRNAGLAVTVLDSSQRRHDGHVFENNPVIDINNVYASRFQSSTAAQTFEERDMRRANHSAQILDDRYASSYQVSHCRVVPTSPPVLSSEFPQQKPSFCPYQGNFEVGERSAEMYYPARDTYGSAVIWPDRGGPSIHGASISRGTSLFADSLRKYPSRSPQRAPSADMIHRLLVSTHDKYLTKNHTRSMRSLIKKPRDKPRDIDNSTSPARMSSKNAQTFAKARQESPTKDSNAITSAEANKRVSSETAERKPGNSSPKRDVRNGRHERQIDTKYDYLKSGSRRVSASRATEVHYLDDISRCVRDTLRHIYEDQTVVCPRIASRYSQHRRECPTHARRRRSTNFVHTEVQTSPSSRVSCDVSCMTRGASPLPVSQLPPTCFYCQKPLPCSCGRSSSLLRKVCLDYPRCVITPPTCKFNLYISDEEPCPYPEDFGKIIDDLVFDWLKDIPVNADYTPEDKAVREQMAKNLADELKQWIDDPNLMDRAKVEAYKCLMYLPMWYPDKIGEMTFRNQIADNLLDRLKKWNSCRFAYEISILVNGINFKVGERVDRAKVKEDFITKLKPILLNRPSNDDEYRNALKSATYAILDDLPIDYTKDVNKNVKLTQLANNLAKKLVALPTTLFGDENEAKKGSNLGEINYIEEIPELADALKKSGNQQIMHKLADELVKLQKEGMDEKEIREKMKEETKKLLDSVINNGSVSLGQKVKTKLTEDLLNKLIDTAPSDEDSLQNKLQQIISNLFEENPALSYAFEKNENQQKLLKLLNNLINLQAQGLDDGEIRKEMKQEIMKLIESIIENEGFDISPKALVRLTENLLNKLTNMVEKSDNTKIVDSFQNEFQQDMKDLFKDTPELTVALEKKENQQQFQNLAKKLAKLQKYGLDDEEIREEMKKETKKLLNSISENTNMTPKAKIILTEILLNKFTNTAQKAEHSKGVGALQHKFQQDIKYMLECVPELANAFQNKVNEDQVQKLAKKLADLHKQGLDDAEIREEIKKETRKCIDSVLENEDTDITPKVKAKLIDILLIRLTDTAKKVTEQCESNANIDENDSIFDLLDDIEELRDELENLRDELENGSKYKIQQSILSENNSIDDDSEEIFKIIEDWFNENSNIPRGNITDNKKMLAKLARKLKNVRSKLGVDEIRDKAESDIKEWLDDMFEKNGTKSDRKGKNELSETLLANLNNSAKRSSIYDSTEIVLRSTSMSAVETNLDKKFIDSDNRLGRKRWSKQIGSQPYSTDELSDIDENKSGTDLRVRRRSSQGVKSQSPSGKCDTEDRSRPSASTQRTNPKEITDYFETGIYYVEEFTNHSTPLRKKSILSENKTGDKSRSSRTKRSISIVVQKGMDKLDTPGSGSVVEEIVDILHAKGVPDRKARTIAEDIVKKAKAKYKPTGRNSDVDKIRLDTSEIDIILSDAGILNLRDGIRRSITDFLSDEIVRGKLNDQTRGSLHNILLDADTEVSQEQAELASEALVSRARTKSHQGDSSRKSSQQGVSSRKASQQGVSSRKASQQGVPSRRTSQQGVSSKRESAASVTEKSRLNLPAIQEQEFQENTEQVITKVVTDIIRDIPPREQQKVRRLTELLAENVKDIVSDRNTSPSDMSRKIEIRVREFLKEMPIDTHVPVEEVVNELVGKLESQIPSVSHKPIQSANRRPSSTPGQKQVFQEIDVQKNSDVVSDVTHNLSTREQQKARRLTELLAENLKDLIANPNARPTEKKAVLENQVRNFSTQVPLDTDIPEKVLESQLVDKLENQIPSAFSNPKTSKIERHSLTPRQEQVFQESAIKEISDFIDDVTGDLSSREQQKIRRLTELLAENLTDLISNPRARPSVIKATMEAKVREFLQQVPIDINEPEEELVSQLVEKLESQIPSAPRNSRALSVGGPSLTPMQEQQSAVDETYPFIPRQSRTSASQRTSFTPNQRQIFQDKAEKEITDFINDILGDTTAREQLHVRRLTTQLANNLKNIVYDGGTIPSEVILAMEDEVRDFLRNVPLDTDIPEEKLVNHLVCRLEKEIPSTPRHSAATNKGFLFSTGVSSLNLAQQKAFQDAAKQEVGDLVTGIINDASPRTLGIIRKSTDEFVENVTEIVADGNFSPAQKMELIENVVREYVKQMPSEVDVPEEYLIKQILIKLGNQTNENPDLVTSTPRRSSAKTSDPITSTPRRASARTFDPSMSPIRDTSYADDANKNNEQIFFHKLQVIIDQWINELPIAKDLIKNKNQREAMVSDLASDIIDRQRYLQLNPDAKTSNEEELEHLKYQVFKGLNKMLDKNYITPFLPNIADLMDRIRRIPVGALISSSSKLLQDELSKFIKRVPSSLFTTTDKNYQQRMIEDLADRLLIDLNSSNVNLSINNDISLWMAKIINASKLEIDKMVDELKRILEKRGLLDNKQCAKAYKKPAVELFDIIDKWCEDLPIHGGDSPEEQEKIKTLKQNLSSKLINKVAELNLNPEILNDNFLYRDLLIDEIDKLLDTIPKNPELDKYLPALKRDLASQIKDTRYKIMNELAGQAYKHQLRDAISASIQLPECLSYQEQASFEILKDNLIDAFISLHYVECVCVNDEERDRLKDKIASEINRFCNEYLRRHPRAPIDPYELNQQLYNTLRNVPVPKDESMISEVEELRIKDVINEWVKSLTLKDETGWELVQRNKTVSVLAKHLHEIEKVKESISDFDNVGKMLEEIYKWLKKCPFKPDFEQEMPRAVEKLIELLRITEQSRKFDITKSTFSATALDCCRQSRAVPTIPSCTLSLSDRLHLQKIRERVRARCPNTRETAVRPLVRDACIDPPPVDTGSQTDVRPWCSTTADWNQSYPSWAAPLYPKMTTSSFVQATPDPEVPPNVIIREYGWDSNDSSQLQGSCLLQSPGTLNSPCRQNESLLFKPLQQTNQNITSTSPKPSIQSQSYFPKPSICKCCNGQSCNQKENTRISAETSGEECRAGTSSPTTKNTCKKSKEASPEEESEWSSFRFPEDTDFWGSCSKTKRYMCRKPMRFEPFTREREKREEKLRCKCKERIKYSCNGTTSPGRSKRERSCDEALKGCSKCGAERCPHPSYLYFR